MVLDIGAGLSAVLILAKQSEVDVAGEAGFAFGIEKATGMG